MTPQQQKALTQLLFDMMLLYNEKLVPQFKSLCKGAFSPAQFLILATICYNEDLTMSALAQITSMQKQQVSKIAGFLVDNGYVQRLSEESDHRIVRIAPTEAGRAYVTSYIKDKLVHLSEAFSELSDQEGDELLSALQTMTLLMPKMRPLNK